jgi:hypothetical protein
MPEAIAANLYRTTPNPDASLPPAQTRRRKPLGLRPDVATGPPASEAALGEPYQYEDPVVALVAETNELLVGLLDDQRRYFEGKISAVQLENAQLQAGLAELKTQVVELAFASEKLKGENRDREARKTRPARAASQAKP